MASASMSLPRACNLHAARAAVLASSATSNSASSAFFRPSISFLGHALETQLQSRGCQRRRAVVVRAEEVQNVQEVQEMRDVQEVLQEVEDVKDANEVKEVTRAQGLSREVGGQWLSCTTRHVRIFSGYVDPETNLMDQMQLDKLTLMLDPDNEFIWPEEATEKVFDKYRELIDTYAGADFTEYTLRLIGSDLEHYIRRLLLDGDLKYNLECRVLNFSMGKPRMEADELDDVEFEVEDL